MLEDQIKGDSAEEHVEFKNEIGNDAADEQAVAEDIVDGIVELESVDAEESDDVETEEATLESLQIELEEALAKNDEYLDGWQRARAEFANYKKRIDREQAQIYQTTTGNIIKHYLDIVDDLDLALKNRPQDGDGASWANGIELIYRKLLTILDNEGVVPMEAAGAEFDPNFHEAISSEPNDDFESGQIIEVIKNGYLLGERVLRPALVRVAQ